MYFFLFVYALFLPSSSCIFFIYFLYIHFNITFHSTYVLSMTLVLLFYAIYKHINTYLYIPFVILLCLCAIFTTNKLGLFFVICWMMSTLNRDSLKKKLHHIQSIKQKENAATKYVVCNLRICFVFGVLRIKMCVWSNITRRLHINI